MALPLCVPRRPHSASNPSSLRSSANIIPSYIRAASQSSPVLQVESVVLPHGNWPGKKSSVHSIISPFPSPSLLMFRGGGGASTSSGTHLEVTWNVVSCCAPTHRHGCLHPFPAVPYPRFSLWSWSCAVLTRDPGSFYQARTKDCDR